MNEISKIAERIERRKKQKTNRLLKFGSIFMGLFSFLLAGLIYVKQDQTVVYFNQLFKSNINFTSFNRTIDKFFNGFLRFNFQPSDDIPVDGEVGYIILDDNFFSTTDNTVTALDNGIISYVNLNDKVITVQYLTYQVFYQNLEEILVKPHDEIKKGDKFASFNEKFKATFFKDNRIVKYGEIFDSI